MPPLSSCSSDPEKMAGELVKIGKRETIFRILSESDYNRPAKYLTYYFDFLVLISVFSLCCETVVSWRQSFRVRLFWFVLETFISAQFMTRLVIKFICASNPLKDYLSTWSCLFDILGVFPWPIECYLFVRGSSSSGNALRFMRFLRLGRILQFHPLTLPEMRLFGKAVRMSKPALLFLSLYLVVVLVFFAWAIFMAETANCHLEGQTWWLNASTHENGPAVKLRCPLQNMFESLWLCISTLVTVGYGDVYPVSPLAKVLASLLMITSLIAFPLAAGFFGANLTELLIEERLNKKLRKSMNQTRTATYDPSPVDEERKVFTVNEKDVNSLIAEQELRDKLTVLSENFKDQVLSLMFINKISKKYHR